jgi:hypothetical protein
MDFVTKETALELEKAGFPQPRPAFGQVWYETDGSPRPQVVTSMEGYEPQGIVFAPRATDIMPHLFSFVLANDFENDANGHAHLIFACYDPDSDRKMMMHKNSAEVLAKAWLKYK